MNIFRKKTFSHKKQKYISHNSISDQQYKVLMVLNKMNFNIYYNILLFCHYY